MTEVPHDTSEATPSDTQDVIYVIRYDVKYSNGDHFVGRYLTYYNSEDDAIKQCQEGGMNAAWAAANPDTDMISAAYQIDPYARILF